MLGCIRIYPNNSFTRFQTEDRAGVVKWVEHNRIIRPHAALIVDGVIVERGHLSEEQIIKRVAQIDQKPHYPWTDDPLRPGGSEEVRCP